MRLLNQCCLAFMHVFVKEVLQNCYMLKCNQDNAAETKVICNLNVLKNFKERVKPLFK